MKARMVSHHASWNVILKGWNRCVWWPIANSKYVLSEFFKYDLKTIHIWYKMWQGLFLFAAWLHVTCFPIPLPPFPFSPLSSIACSAWLCLSSIVWDVEKAARLLGEPAADCEYKTFDFTVAGCALRYLTAELPTQRPVCAAITPDTMEHGKKRRSECPGKSRLTARTSVLLCSALPYGRSTESSLAFTSSPCNVLFLSSHNLISCWCCVALEMAQW